MFCDECVFAVFVDSVFFDFDTGHTNFVNYTGREDEYTVSGIEESAAHWVGFDVRTAQGGYSTRWRERVA